jgi:hypothetical protein
MSRPNSTTNNDESSPIQELYADERGVSAVVGAILMFGLLMALLVTIQATAVPVWNQGIEYQHNTRVGQEFASVHGDIRRSAAIDREFASAIELGATYPTRPFLISPPDPSGTIRTTPEAPVTVSGAVASNEAGDYWSGSPVTYTTRSLVYEADYNELRNAPRYVIDNSALFRQYDNATLTEGEPTLIDDRRINLLLLNGSLAQSGTSSRSLTVSPISAPATTTTVRAANQPITITVPTLANAEYWQSALANERKANGGHITALSVRTQEGSAYNLLRIQLEQGLTYQLRTAKIGVGTEREHDVPHYLTTGTGDPTMSVSETQQYTFVVKDKYNNPIDGVDLNATVVEGPGEIVSVSGPSDPNGVVTVRYTSSTAGTARIQATFGSSPNSLQTATHTVETVAPPDTGGGRIDQGLDSNVVVDNVSASLLFDANEVAVTFNNQGQTAKRIAAARFVAFYDGVILCPCPEGVRIGSATPTIFHNQPVTNISPSVALDPGTTTVKLGFRNEAGAPAAVDSQDQVILELVFADGIRSTYLIQLDTESAV